MFLLGSMHTYMMTVFTRVHIYVHISVYIIIWISEKRMTDMQCIYIRGRSKIASLTFLSNLQSAHVYTIAAHTGREKMYFLASNGLIIAIISTM